MDNESDISSSQTIKKSGFEVAEGLKYRFDIETKRRRLKSRDALAQALELWLGTSSGIIQAIPAIALGSPSEVDSTGSVTKDISLLATGLASIQSQIAAIVEQNERILTELRNAPKRAQGRRNLASPKTEFDRELERVFEGVGGDKQRGTKTAHPKAKMVAKKPSDLRKTS